MPSKNLDKVQKSVAKKKGRGVALHERSRDARRINQASRRQDRLAALASRTDQSHRPYLDRMLFLQEAIGEQDQGLPEVEFKQLVEDLIARNDANIKDLEASRRPGRPPSNNETKLKQRRSFEQTEYTAGLWVPDLRDAKSLSQLSTWKGEWSALGELRYCRVAKDGTVQPSAFPPKGGH